MQKGDIKKAKEQLGSKKEEEVKLRRLVLQLPLTKNELLDLIEGLEGVHVVTQPFNDLEEGYRNTQETEVNVVYCCTTWSSFNILSLSKDTVYCLSVCVNMKLQSD